MTQGSFTSIPATVRARVAAGERVMLILLDATCRGRVGAGLQGHHGGLTEAETATYLAGFLPL